MNSIKEIIYKIAMPVLLAGSIVTYVIGYNSGKTQGCEQGYNDAKPIFILWRDDDTQMIRVGNEKTTYSVLLWDEKSIAEKYEYSGDTIIKKIHASIIPKYNLMCKTNDNLQERIKKEYDSYEKDIRDIMRTK